MIINTNVASLTAREAATNTNNSISGSLEKLSTGLRINKAADDASGLAIADKLRTQASSIDQGVANGTSAVSLLQIADKSMSEQSNILDIVKTKLIQANTATTSSDGREAIRKDIAKLLEQLDNIAEQTNYNGNTLLQDSATSKLNSADLNFQIGETNADIISNTSIQSNTLGLGSRTEYQGDQTIASTESLIVGSNGSINITGTDSSDTTSIEDVTLTGDVDELTLSAGMSISGVDAATKTVLDAAVTAGNLTESSGTYTATTAGIGKAIDLSSNDNVTATVQNVSTTSTLVTAAVDSAAITSGQIVTTTATGGSVLGLELDKAENFQKLGDNTYRALSAQTLTLAVGDEIKVSDLNNLVSGTGSTTFNAGDVINATNVTTGSYLDLELKDTSKFTSGGSGKYTVLDDYTAGDLNIGVGESITITQGQALSTATAVTGLTESAWKVGPTGTGTDLVRLATGSADLGTQTTASGGVQAAVTAGNILQFTVTGATGSTGGLDYSIKAGDIITISDDSSTGSTDQLSKDVLEGTDFLNLGSGKYQAKSNVDIEMDVGDIVTVSRIISGGADTVVSGNTASTITGTAAVTTAGNNDANISVKTDSTISIQNNDTTTGSKLSVSNDGTNDLYDNGTQLNALATLAQDGLTAELADTLQDVVDNALTDLNTFRGDIGSTQNQVESAVRNLMTQSTNVKAAESVIRDVDYAKESAEFNKQNIIAQAGTYAMTQANATQKNVMKLLQ